jgi:hypothetical protein
MGAAAGAARSERDAVLQGALSFVLMGAFFIIIIIILTLPAQAIQ